MDFDEYDEWEQEYIAEQERQRQARLDALVESITRGKWVDPS